jgi:hypothetical protein
MFGSFVRSTVEVEKWINLSVKKSDSVEQQKCKKQKREK